MRQFHLITRVFEDRGIPIKKENDEIFAYYQHGGLKNYGE